MTINYIISDMVEMVFGKISFTRNDHEQEFLANSVYQFKLDIS